MLRKFGCALLVLLALLCACACAQGAFDETRELGDGYTAVCSGGKWGVISAEGETILPVENDIIYLSPEGKLIYYRENEVWSLRPGEEATRLLTTETAGDTRLAPQFSITGKPYDSLSPSPSGYSVAHLKVDSPDLYAGADRRMGITNADGELILPCYYTKIELEPDGTGIAYTTGQYWMRFRLEGNEVHFYREENGQKIMLPAWSMNWADVIPLGSQPVTYLAHTLADDPVNAWALVDADGSVLENDYLHDIYSYGFEERGYTLVQRDGYYGYLDYTGGFMVEPQFKEADFFSNGLALVADKYGKYGFIDESGAYVIKPEYDDMGEFRFGYAPAAYKVLIEEESDDFSGGPAHDFYWGLIDTEGEIALPLEYDELGEIADDGTVTAEKNNKSYIFALTPEGVNEVKSVASSLSLEDYMPFTGKKVAKLGEEPTLEERASADHGHPRLDGATALFPVYSAIVEAVYPEKTRYGEADKNPLVTCTKTNKAYDRLIAGDADIIFCAGPSDAQVAAAKAQGVEFELTPFGREAFVFIVNKENPLDDISVDNIRKVYSGETTDWETLGVSGLGDIVAYQRPENSGSQTALQRLMGDTPIMEAPKENIPSFMEDIIENVEYRNLANAIGYTFRFFCTEMTGSDVKLLSIDGVEPSLENIRGESYPITSTLYMVTRKGEDNPNVQALIDWVLSEQGQSLVEKAGYVGVN